jgi:dTDP-4-amino-4,6-dideoxygalactose transaminase
MLVPLVRPTLRRKDYNSVLNCLVNDQIAAGPLNQELAAALSKTFAVSGGVGLISYRSCIHCALELMELEQGDGVILSALAPKEYLQIIEERGLIAMIADVAPQRPLLSVDSVEQHLREGAKAIVLSYTLGSLPAGAELFRLGVPVIEDVTQAAGGLWGGQPCGSRGRVALLSLDPGGSITAGCGGAVFSADRRGVRTLKEIVARGHGGELLPDMNAALGINQVRELPRFLQKRDEIAQVFREALLRSRHSPLLEEGASVNFGFPVLVKEGRPEVRRYAEKRGIQTEAAFSDAVLSQEGAVSTASGSYPNAEQFLRRALLFPLYPSLARKDIQLLCRILSTLP